MLAHQKTLFVSNDQTVLFLSPDFSDPVLGEMFVTVKFFTCTGSTVSFTTQRMSKRDRMGSVRSTCKSTQDCY